MIRPTAKINKTLRIAAALILLALSGLSADGEIKQLYAYGPGAPEVQAEAAVLVDYETGKVLYNKNGDRPVPPASLAKLMTMHLVLKEVDSGRLSLNRVIDVPEEAYWKNLPPGSSLMFLEPGQKLTVKDLLLGLAVSSGNDAAIAAAVLVSGSIEAFLEEMNAEAAGLGLPLLHFADASGLDPRSCITAEQFAEFCRYYVRSHPRALDLFHAVREYTYPAPVNVPGAESVNGYTQGNRNGLLHTYEGLDGLKSGYIDESGYNVAVTAKKEGMRLIGVLLGGTGVNHSDGRNRIAGDAESLLDFGFKNFVRVYPKNLPIPTVRIWKGKKDAISCIPEHPVLLTVPKNAVNAIGYRVETVKHLVAPVSAGEGVGTIFITLHGSKLRSVPLVTKDSVDSAGPIKRLFHSVGMRLDTRRNKK